MVGGSGGRILVADDDAAICTVVGEALRRQQHEVLTVGSIAALRAAMPEFRPDVLVTDVIMPDGNGLDVVPELLADAPGLPIIVLSAQNTLTTAVRATEQGAFEYLPKPFDLEELCRAVADGVRSRRTAGATREADQIDESLPLIGRSAPMQEVYRTIARVVANDLTVLVLGESGTGKELVARAIHDLGRRRHAPFVAVNMAAIPRELIESELFGHERGAFTGAHGRAAGRFEQAQGGTLFLDEIGDMPMDAQTRLLRVLQSGEFTTVGGTRLIRADVRIIAATHKNLPEMIAQKTFREDLYYRLAVVPISLPSLRQRGGDIGELAQHFLERAAQEGLPRKYLDGGAVLRLEQHDWPGNVRELENLMRRLAVLAREDVVSAVLVEQQLAGGPRMEDERGLPGPDTLAGAIEAHLSRYFAAFGRDLPPDGLYDRVIAEIEGPLLEITLAAVKGNQLKAAKLLGINRNTLRKKLNDHQLETRRLRQGG